MSTRHSFLSTTGLIRPVSAASAASVADSYYVPNRLARSEGTTTGKPIAMPQPHVKKPPTTRAGIIPLGPMVIVSMAVTLSLLFTAAISLAFIPDDDNTSAIASMLDDVAANTPGIVLFGDDVDVDVDEPALTIRWSIIGCGDGFVLEGSEGTHGSQNCGLPSMALELYVDGEEGAAGSYNPDLFPFFKGGGQRDSIQNMFQFDDDHVLNVHEARLYPFDNYRMTTSIRAVSTADNATVPIQKLATISMTSSFVTLSSDTESAVTIPSGSGSDMPTRDLVLQISRPADLRAYALLLFGTSWMLAHATIGLVVISWSVDRGEKMLQYLGITFAIVLLIPQMRNAMPDAPGFDGKSIGRVM
ncbi:hypothetical protein BD311DRAFT_846030 [Dichomitus squalens]|uniref:Uncharacterized protein n=1 Tax=Dichomitus squalens TaxID=114155 RepID=A0A4Q9MKD1_9APHY|nr:hypothetical protein BD311DRAFT_846030 [Dichomitus squalens]